MNKKRFIAGALCPACSLQDKLRMWRVEDGSVHIDCVNCGFSDTLGETETMEPPSAKFVSGSTGGEEIQILELRDIAGDS